MSDHDEISEVWIPIADGIHHDHRCVNNVATAISTTTWLCVRCRLEAAERHLTHLQQEKETLARGEKGTLSEGLDLPHRKTR